MARIVLVTRIEAPATVCFDLSRNVDFHASVKAVPHRPVAGITSGPMCVGDSVTWSARQFGLVIHMTSKILEMDAPGGFVDEMQEGPFRHWRHRHVFESVGGGTVMRDEVDFASPLGPLGQIVDGVFMRRHMSSLLVAQNRHLKAVAEGRA